jgi:hypothetical protein
LPKTAEERKVLCNQNTETKDVYVVNFNRLKHIRQHIYESFDRGADALFNLADALLCESQAQSLPELSLSPFFERQWPSVYEALEDGRINVEQVRAIWVSVVLAERAEHDPIWIAVDGSNIARPSAPTSADRTIIHLPNLPLVDKPISIGWAFSTVVVLPEQASSWTPILEHKRGAPPKDGPLFQGKRPETHGQACEEWREHPPEGRQVRISRWNHLHFQQDRELDLSVIRVEREAAKGTKRDPRVSWFVMLDAIVPLPQIAQQYRRRFSQEHGYRFRHRKHCSGRRCMCAPLSNLNAGVGWWRWC